MDIFEHFKKIISPIEEPVIFEFGTCDGHQTKEMCKILKEKGKKFKYYAFEADPRIISTFKHITKQYENNITLVQAAIGNKDANVKFYLSSGHETRPNKVKQVFYGSSSIRKPKDTLIEFPDMKFEYCVVKSIKFDTYYNNVNPGKIDFIWADIQGAEIDLIKEGQIALSNTRYLYTEFYENEMYEGQIGLNEIIKKLPGTWTIIEKYDFDVLLKNEDFK